MSVKIRLQRHGKKGKPFYWIVAADARAKRDGRFLEKLGTYNPNTNPATVNLDVDGAVKWLQNGAQPTDTAKTILSYKGAMLKNHLVGGVRKGALTEEQAIEYLIMKDCPQHVWRTYNDGNKQKMVICRKDQLPATREWRNAWKISDDLSIDAIAA